MQFTDVVILGRDRAWGDLEGVGGTPAVHFVTGSVCSRDMAVVEVIGRGDSVVGGGDDIVGEVGCESPTFGFTSASAAAKSVVTLPLIAS